MDSSGIYKFEILSENERIELPEVMSMTLMTLMIIMSYTTKRALVVEFYTIHST